MSPEQWWEAVRKQSQFWRTFRQRNGSSPG